MSLLPLLTLIINYNSLDSYSHCVTPHILNPSNLTLSVHLLLSVLLYRDSHNTPPSS